MSDIEKSELKEIRKTLESLCDKFSKVEKLLGGDWQDPDRIGLIHTNRQLMNEVYDPKNGVLIRIGRLEITKREAMAWGGGVAFAVSALFAIAAYILIPMRR